MMLARTTCAAVLFLAGTALCSAQIPEHPMCSDATLNGDYGFTIVGQILSPALAAGLVSGVAMTHFDGHGNMTQVDHVLHNGGIPPAEEWRPGKGPYHVNEDCTGYMVITAEPTVASDTSPVLRLEFVVSNYGHRVDTVVTGSPTVPTFKSAITSTGIRTY